MYFASREGNLPTFGIKPTKDAHTCGEGINYILQENFIEIG